MGNRRYTRKAYSMLLNLQKQNYSAWACWLVECCFTSTKTVGLLETGAQDGHLDFHTAPEFCLGLQSWLLAECCFTSTETVGLLVTGAQDGHLDFHTAPELCAKLQSSKCFIQIWLWKIQGVRNVSSFSSLN